MTPKNVESALNSWRSCRDLLATAVQCYASACANLNAVCTRPPLQPHEERTIDSALVDIDRELCDLSLREEALHTARVSLAGARNTSKVLAPLHTLPPEILTHIFLIAQSGSGQHNTEDISLTCSLAGVSSYWRRITLSTPSLWTDISITTQTSYDHASLFLLRSNNLPVSVYLYEPGSSKTTTRHWSERLATILVQASPRVSSLDIESWAESTQVISVALKYFLIYGSTSAEKTVRIMRPRAAMMPKRLAPSWPSELPSIDRAEAVLLSVSVLHLQEVVLPWTSAAYHGLIDLRLEFNKGLSEARVSITNLANMFTASLTLETLKLSGLAIAVSDDWDSSTHVSLTYLRVLCLSNMLSESWELVLSLISLSDCLNTLSVGFKTHNQSELASPICRFLRESPVETLAFTEGSGSGASPFWVLEASTAAPLLKNLILVQAIFFEDEECDTLAALLVDMSSSSLRLPNLYMVSSLLDFSDLQLVVPRYGVQSLHFERCSTVFSMSDIPDDPKTPEELRDRLLDSWSGLECAVSDIDTTADWPCRTMFD